MKITFLLLSILAPFLSGQTVWAKFAPKIKTSSVPTIPARPSTSSVPSKIKLPKILPPKQYEVGKGGPPLGKEDLSSSKGINYKSAIEQITAGISLTKERPSNNEIKKNSNSSDVKTYVRENDQLQIIEEQKVSSIKTPSVEKVSKKNNVKIRKEAPKENTEKIDKK